MVPDGWNDLSLGQLYDFKNGLNAEKSSYGHGTPFVNVMDIFAADQLSAEALRGSVAASEKTIREFSVNYGDILFNRTSETVEEIAYSAVYLDTQPAVFGGFVIRGRPKSKSVDAQYSKYLFKSAPFRREVIKACQGAVRANIGQKDLAKIEVPLPPLPEQKKIAQIICTWDQAITATERLLENSQQRKKGLMQQLLTGKKRLPGFETEWESVPIKELLIPKKSKCGDASHPVYSVTKHGLVSQDEYFKKSVAADDLSGYLIVDHADFVMSGLNFWMGSVDVHTKPFPVIVSPAYKVFSLSQKVDASYFRNLIQTSLFKRILEGSSVMGASIVRRNFNKELFMEWPIKLPSITEQKAISSSLDTENALVHHLSSKLLSLKQEKKALMQQLLTGKRRVSVETEAA